MGDKLNGCLLNASQKFLDLLSKLTFPYYICCYICTESFRNMLTMVKNRNDCFLVTLRTSLLKFIVFYEEQMKTKNKLSNQAKLHVHGTHNDSINE